MCPAMCLQLLSVQSNSRVSDIVNIFETIISNDGDNQQQSITSCCSAITRSVQIANV